MFESRASVIHAIVAALPGPRHFVPRATGDGLARLARACRSMRSPQSPALEPPGL